MTLRSLTPSSVLGVSAVRAVVASVRDTQIARLPQSPLTVTPGVVETPVAPLMFKNIAEFSEYAKDSFRELETIQKGLGMRIVQKIMEELNVKVLNDIIP